jgi:formylglycine-generating enzyme
MRIRALTVLLVVLTVCSCAKEKTFTEGLTGMRFVHIPAGEFAMGSPANEPGHQKDETLHRVVISRPFYLGATEVTQRQWQAVMGYNPSAFPASGPDAPVERVSWNQVQEFVRRLNRRVNGRFRLPTEAEWEYACRAGTATPYSFGMRITTEQANYDGRYPLPGQPAGVFREATAPAASYPPNRWGLYDMHGNVWEWCADEYCPYPAGAVRDPFNSCRSPYKVIRGGSWYFGADSARSALRYTHEPQLSGFSIGFRLACDAEAIGDR